MYRLFSQIVFWSYFYTSIFFPLQGTTESLPGYDMQLDEFLQSLSNYPLLFWGLALGFRYWLSHLIFVSPNQAPNFLSKWSNLYNVAIPQLIVIRPQLSLSVGYSRGSLTYKEK